MDQSLPLSDEILNAELARLYAKRRMLNELIRTLERYAEFEAKPRTSVMPGTAAITAPPQLAVL